MIERMPKPTCRRRFLEYMSAKEGNKTRTILLRGFFEANIYFSISPFEKMKLRRCERYYKEEYMKHELILNRYLLVEIREGHGPGLSL